MKIDLVMDLQYGSTGKGLLAGYLAETSKPDGVATCNMPNAGHTYIDSKGQKMVHKVLPNGIVSPNLKYVFIGPGAVFSVDRLREEIHQAFEFGYLSDVKIVVHPNACIWTPDCAEMEEDMLNGIASTMQGSMAAQVLKMGRQEDHNNLAYDNLEPFLNVVVADSDTWMDCVSECGHILAEGSQGFSLGVNQRFWPFCTSRECTPYRLLSDMGLPQIKAEVWGTLRTYPIRVGNTPGGFSGPVYYDQRELSWEDLGFTPETTTVTGRERRVFTFSYEQLKEALWHCRPDHLFLNFANYMDEHSLAEMADLINWYAGHAGTGIRLMGYGPSMGDVREYRG